MSILKIRPFFNFLLFFSEYEVSFFYSTTIGSWIISLILPTLIQLHRPFCFYVKRLKYKAYRCSPVLNKLTKHSRFKYKSVYCTNLVLIYIFISMYFFIDMLLIIIDDITLKTLNFSFSISHSVVLIGENIIDYNL